MCWNPLLLICSSNEGSLPVVVGPIGVESGMNDCKNNPDCQMKSFEGPVPTGNYTIEKHPTRPNWWKLTPSAITRIASGFRGGLRLHPGQVSQGCITIMDTDQSAMIQYNLIQDLLNRENGRNTLVVIP